MKVLDTPTSNLAKRDKYNLHSNGLLHHIPLCLFIILFAS